MKVIENKDTVVGKRLGTTLKTQPHAQPALNDLRKNLQERGDLEAYVRQMITTSDVGPVMETISRAAEQGPSAVNGWYTVTVAECAGLPDSEIYTALNWVLIPLKVDFFNFRRSGAADNDDKAEFMLDSTLSANRLKRLKNNVMVMYSCRKLEIDVRPGLPVAQIMERAIRVEFENAVEAALHSRYDSATRTLDLTRFHADPRLADNFCPLHITKMLDGVLFLARRKLQHTVVALILTNNYICSLEAFAAISGDDFSALQRLDITGNKIKDLGELKYLSQLPIKSLVLSGNEVAKLDSDDIREILPQLKEIHGCVQAKEKVRVLDNLPKPQQFHAGGSVSAGLEFAQRFVKCYYDSFDDPAQRQELAKLYDPQAAFSVSVPKQLGHVNVYRLYNRNHQSLHSQFARNAKLQVGSTAVIQALGRFPRILTNIQTASLDILAFSARLCILVLTGPFKEQASQGWEQRHFQRTFVLRRPEGHSGWLITNDMLSVIAPHVEQQDDISTPPGLELKASVKPGTLEDKSTNMTNESSSKPVTDPVEQAFQDLSLSLPRMALGTEERDEVLPALVVMPPLSASAPIAVDHDLNDELELEFDWAQWSDDTLVIDEEALLADKA